MEFANTIISWFRENGRALPWRETRDPYAIWLSEIILQQTRIAQGWEYWERFMAQYPTVQDLAAAHEDEVLKLWQGLGHTLTICQLSILTEPLKRLRRQILSKINKYMVAKKIRFCNG